VVRAGKKREVRAFDGAAGSRTLAVFGPGFSSVVAVMRDVDHDGILDVVIRARRKGKKIVRAFSGRTLSPLRLP
jgi:hypothetical protein